MPDTTYRWPLEAIWEEVSPNLPDFSVEVLPEIDSTNTELMRRARAGQCDPVLLVAEHQTAGRGRLGRQWLGAGKANSMLMPSLMFSLGMPLQCADWSGLSLAVGMSVAKSLRALCPPDQAADIGLKWPNDVWWQGRKLAGILIETAAVPTAAPAANTADSARYAIIGIGVNILAPMISTSAQQGQLAPAMPVGLQTIAPGAGAAQTLKQLALPLVQALMAFEKRGFAPLVGDFAGLDLLEGKAVVLSDGRSGMARGVDGTGALQVDIKGERHSISSGEVSVRPLHNTVLTMNGHG